MNKISTPYPSVLGIAWLLLFCISCAEKKQPPAGSDIVAKPEDLHKKVVEDIRAAIDFAVSNENNIGDSFILFNTSLVQSVYEKNNYEPVWSGNQRWKALADSMLQFIKKSKLYGLFPEDYHYKELHRMELRLIADSLGKLDRKDAALWSRADILLTDAFMHIVSDIKLGRLPNDSISMRKDSILANEFYLHQFDTLQQLQTLLPVIATLEPAHEGYRLLKEGIARFLDSADYNEYTKVPAPSKKETPEFRVALQKRLYEGGYLAFDSVAADSTQLADAVKSFQKQKGITIDGKAGEGTVRWLNTTDRDRFIRIAISLDRYKLLPEKMPEKYIWVNLPSFYMRLHDKDSVKLVSKIVCGKVNTRTPLLTSAISEIITYPQWTPPNSIIVKEILPAAKRDPGYFAKKGFSVLDQEGNEVDPYTVEWSRYSKGIPYKVVQGSGDANALGVLKFNFPNKYAVYLHDTNQRSLFGVPVRTLSHGCVRVQEWQKLAYYIIRNEKPTVKTEKLPMLDSMNSWLSRKEKHVIPVRNRVPVYIRYFTCEGKDGKVVFYDDIYSEDKKLRERWFASK